PYSDWAKSDIEKAIALNIINVGGNYNFPAPITREEFCELIYNYCYNVIKEVDTVTGENKFTDTTNSKIIRLNAMGIINGKSETEFAPNDLLTREEAAVILNRMVNKTVPVPVTEMYFAFDDEASISAWASDSIQIMCNMGVMNGVGDNKFAPKETYTTEQAIATIVRVYAAQSANSGIIGGADAPTEIVVTDTINVNDFYVDEAIKLITESGELAADKDFISLYTTNDEMTNKILALSKVDFNKPKEIYYLSADREQIIANLEALAKAEGVDLNEMGDIWVEHILNKFNFSTLASLINSSYGAENLAALTILTNSRGYIMPKDFKNNFALFVQYEGDYSAIVSFYEYGDGVISANMSFVKNGDKDNVFRRMYEITSAVGEDGIKIAKVK
ncbi:MAG: S-layer homology domain-containing protein, partial [Clostridia bacterium]|nr:S-layer homology domain-containing protein [Clostridia bacterium]